MVMILKDFAEQSTLSEQARVAAKDAANFIELVTAAIFDDQDEDPSLVVEAVKRIYVEHQFG